MRIHTNATAADIHAATGNLPGVYAERLAEHRSATHARAFELNLTGNGYQVNSGNTGAGYYPGATWDEWGVVMAGIFSADPTTRMGGTQKDPVYANADDFHWQTGYRFSGAGLPGDTHKRHSWNFTGWARECKKCSAIVRRAA